MSRQKLILTKANDHSYAELIKDTCALIQPTNVQAAIAYATSSGVAELLGALNPVAAWRKARKQWLVGIDHCRSDPIALSALQDLPSSQVRIYDGEFVSTRLKCAPRISYHPKLYMFTNGSDSAAVVGSGNLSQTGLRIGVEAGASISGRTDPEHRNALHTFHTLWQQASRWQDVSMHYCEQYASEDNRRHPAPVEDDSAPASAGTRGQLTPSQLQQLRVCEHLWIAAGNVTKNRGRGQPGNQLMLKRNSRVFFGFQARELSQNTTIGTVAVKYRAHERPDCSLRYSDNSMDVLTLPLPGDGGPDAYDQQTLLFMRTGVRRFVLELAGNGDVSRWKRASQKVNAAFRMSSGREWGVF